MEAHKDLSSDYFNILIMDAKYEELTPQDFEHCTMVILLSKGADDNSPLSL